MNRGSTQGRRAGNTSLLVVVLIGGFLALAAAGAFFYFSLVGTSGPGRGGGGVTLAAPPTSPDSFGAVAEFALTERSGETVTGETLSGAPYIVSFFFARCGGPCPKLLGNVARLQQRLPDESPVKLVSITVDPDHDTPEYLATYAQNFSADSERWLFLSGTEDAIFGLMRESFHLALEVLPDKDVVMGMQITHDTRLVVVDGAGQVRGYYDGESDEEIEQALERALHLADAEQ